MKHFALVLLHFSLSKILGYHMMNRNLLAPFEELAIQLIQLNRYF